MSTTSGGYNPKPALLEENSDSDKLIPRTHRISILAKNINDNWNQVKHREARLHVPRRALKYLADNDGPLSNQTVSALFFAARFPE